MLYLLNNHIIIAPRARTATDAAVTVPALINFFSFFRPLIYYNNYSIWVKATYISFNGNGLRV